MLPEFEFYSTDLESDPENCKVHNTFSQFPYFTTKDTKLFHKDHNKIIEKKPLTH